MGVKAALPVKFVQLNLHGVEAVVQVSYGIFFPTHSRSHISEDKDNDFIEIRQKRFDSSSCSAPASVRAFFNLRHCRTFEL